MLTIVRKQRNTIPVEHLKKKNNIIPVRSDGLKKPDTNKKIATDDLRNKNPTRTTDVKDTFRNNQVMNKHSKKITIKTALKKKPEKETNDYFGRWHFHP